MIKNILLAFFIIVSGVLFFLFRSSSTSGPVGGNEVSYESESMGDGIDKIADELGLGDSLDLSNRGLDKLPENVLSMRNLESLDISDNNLTGALPAEIKNLQNLKILKANNNNMTGVPAEIGQMSKLEILDLSNNQLTGLPYELGNLKNLKILNLSGNDYAEQDLERIREGLPGDVEIIL
jgi:Leucine-rich repeat (LRR) protein